MPPLGLSRLHPEAPFVGILKESAPGKSRVALLPESLRSLIAQGLAITVEAAAGEAAGASGPGLG